MEPTDISLAEMTPELFPYLVKHRREEKEDFFLFKKWSGLDNASSLLFIIHTA